MDGRELANLVVVDTETTGPDIFVHDLLSVAFVAVASERRFYQHVKSQEAAEWSDYGAKNFSRFSGEWQRSAIEPRRALALAEEFLQDVFGPEGAMLVGHNVAFDRFFLNKLAKSAGKSAVRGLSHRTIDTHTLLMALYFQGRVPKDAVSSDGAFEFFDLVPSDETRHTALGDALSTKRLFLRILEEFLPDHLLEARPARNVVGRL